MDFFLEAMNEWERQKKLNDPLKPHVPPWDVKLKEIIGTSAGGITSTLSVASLNIDHEPLSNRFQQNNPDTPEPKNNPLFRTWVKEMNAERLLSNDDLETTSKDKVPTIKSVLNSNFMKRVSHEVLQADHIKPDLPDWASKVSLSLTATSMRGIPYSVNSLHSESANDQFYMHYHIDYSQFVVTTCPEKVPSELKASRWVLDASAPRDHDDWERVIDCSRATAAFPMGFPSVQIKTPRSHYEKRLCVPPSWPEDEAEDSISGMSSDDMKGDEDANMNVYAAVDGGTLNNEPFGILEDLMVQRHQPESLEPDGKDAWASIILIDPFTTAPADTKVTGEGMSIARMLSPLLNSIRGQAMFKKDELEKASNQDNMAKFMLKPNRHLPQKPKYELATGTMGEFVRILDEKIRLHDFQLGRANCKEFLETVFCINKEDAVKNEIFRQYPDFLKKERIPVIPVVGSAAAPIPIPEWPTYTKDELDRVKENVLGLFRKRIEIMTNLFFEEIDAVKSSSCINVVQWVRNKAAGLVSRYVVDYFRNHVKNDVEDALSNFSQK